MSALVLKLVLTPALVGTASLAGRRWGPAVSGWFVGLPLTSAPIAFFVALSDGPGFASSVALGTMAGTVSQAAFCVAYGWLAMRAGMRGRASWPAALLGGCAAFALSTAALTGLTLAPALSFVGATLPPALSFVGVVLTLALALRAMPRADRAAGVVAPPPRWDLPVRMVVATSFVLLLTGLAPALGARLTGLLAPFPLYAATLTVFAHHQQGAEAAAAVLRGLVLGLFAFAGFFLVLALLLERVGIGAAFAGATAVALALHLASLLALHRGLAPRIAA